MDIKELKKKHPIHAEQGANWDFWWKAYAGGKEFTDECLYRLSRESQRNYLERTEDGYNFNYCKSIIDLFNFYLTEKACKREMGKLHNDPQWKMFLGDCDLNGTDFDIWINDSQKISSVYGSIGVLVNKNGAEGMSIDDEIKNDIYPYCTLFTMPNIWDWHYEKNAINGRPELVYLKLAVGDNQILIWELEKWELWEIPEEKKAIRPKKISDGLNPIEEIPFVWMPNVRNILNPIIGLSDLAEISRIVASIVRNLSCGEEVIKYAGFPMLMVPMKNEGKAPGDPESGEQEVGIRSVLDFDPDAGASAKPDWLESPVLEPIEGVMNWIDKKVDELFRIAHLSGVHGQRKSNNQFASGIALRYEFQQLNSVLLQKSEFMAEAEAKIVRLWLKWQDKEDYFEDIKIERSKAFSIDDLSLSLDNAIKAMNVINSETFHKEIKKGMVRQLTPDLSETVHAKIDAEIDAEPLAEDKDESGSPPSPSPVPEK